MPPRQVNIPRGSTVAQFLDRARTEIQKDFKELRNAPVENLLYARLPAPFHDTLKLFCYILAAIIHSYFATSSRPRVVASGSCAVTNVRYIKEDLILPHDITFHWLIETKARGKSGPLYVPVHHAALLWLVTPRACTFTRRFKT